jgi:hypothetical protein
MHLVGGDAHALALFGGVLLCPGLDGGRHAGDLDKNQHRDATD